MPVKAIAIKRIIVGNVANLPDHTSIQPAPGSIDE